jgi:hypothetical protein
MACFARCINTTNANTVQVAEGRLTACDVPVVRRINRVPAHVERAFSGRCHAFRPGKQERGYPAEAQFRFNRRLHLAEVSPRLMVAMMGCSLWP